MEHYDYVIVGSGLFAGTFAHAATLKGKRCLVVEKRPYLGGNIYCEKIEDINEELYDSNRKSQFLSGIMQPLMMFIGNFGYVAVCIVGALLTMNNITSFGVIVIAVPEALCTAITTLT